MPVLAAKMVSFIWADLKASNIGTMICTNLSMLVLRSVQVRCLMSTFQGVEEYFINRRQNEERFGSRRRAKQQ